MVLPPQLLRRRLYDHVPEAENGIRLLDFLARHYARFDRDGWQRAIAAGDVLVDDHVCSDPAAVLKKHAKVTYLLPADTPEPDADCRFRTVYEDPDLLVLEKPGDLCVHPAGPFFRHTLWHLAASCYGEVYFLHRLDRETSGLIAAARNARTAAALSPEFHPFYKEYAALVFGNFCGTVHAKGVLIPDRQSAVAKKRRFLQDGDPALPGAETAETRFEFIASVPPDLTLVRAIPVTGRQHQIRATLRSLGFPLVGDKLYGPDERLFAKIAPQTLTEADYQRLRMHRQALHASVLEFTHPVTGKRLRFESPCDFSGELLPAGEEQPARPAVTPQRRVPADQCRFGRSASARRRKDSGNP